MPAMLVWFPNMLIAADWRTQHAKLPLLKEVGQGRKPVR